MIQARQIAEILAQYKRHGWILRRVLLSDALRARITSEIPALFGGAQIIRADIDAVWFSRSSKNGEAWELRRLAETPYALFEIFADEDDREVRAEAMREMENRLRG
jgi:hypothetical protein